MKVVKFPTVANHVRILIEAGVTEVAAKVAIGEHFQWSRGELCLSPEALSVENWDTTMQDLDLALTLLLNYELRDASIVGSNPKNKNQPTQFREP